MDDILFTDDGGGLLNPAMFVMLKEVSSFGSDS